MKRKEEVEAPAKKNEKKKTDDPCNDIQTFSGTG